MNIEAPHTRFVPPSAFVLLGLFAILRAASASPDLADKIAASEHKIRSGMSDLGQLAQSVAKRGGVEGEDSGNAMELVHAAEDPLCELARLRELFLIDSLVQNDNAKNKIRELIRYHVNELSESVDRSVAFINVALAGLHNSAIILAGTNLRDDLRESKNLPKVPDVP